MLRRWWRPTVAVNAALVLLVLAGGAWAWYVVWGGESASAGTGAQERVVAVTRGAVSATVSASGTVHSGTTAAANFVTAGTVTEIAVKVGDPVTQGQTLAKVDAAAANGQLSTARANLAAAQQSLTRAQGNGSDAATVASISAQVTQANTAVETAQRAVAGTVLTAPIAGTVIAVNGAVGSPSSGSSSGTSGGGATGSTSSSSSSAASSTGFITLADLTKLQVSAAFAEADATKLKVGQTATVTWSALSGARATARITTIAPTATTANNVNTYAVVSTLDSVPTGARIGQSATVRVTVAEVANALRAPTAAVRTAGGQRTVQVRTAGGDTEQRTVQVGVEGDSFVEITSGLTEGEQLVIQPTTSSTTGTTNQQGPGGQFGGGGQLPGGGGQGPGR